MSTPEHPDGPETTPERADETAASSFARSAPGPGGRVLWIAGPDAANRDALAEALAAVLAEQGAMVLLLPDAGETPAEPELAKAAAQAAANGISAVVRCAGADPAALESLRKAAKGVVVARVYDSAQGQDPDHAAAIDIRLDSAVLDGASACELCLAYLDSWK
ncbi:MAG: hypothetical protein H0S85_12740 [Desulfovibrionaceae bacterium]|jgi:hypothetical protein|nr:hypothetical protein [Desulfovibrionaceae bacterium]